MLLKRRNVRAFKLIGGSAVQQAKGVQYAKNILKKENMKTGVVDVGGGLRGVYTAGVFDYCLDQDIRFDLGIGVSAGSANVASYIAR